VKYSYLSLLPILAFASLGCYTRFSTLEQRQATPERVDRRSDSLRPSGEETCVWERDLMGFPYLHCYKGYYPRDWYQYNFSPWWYQNDSHRYGGSRCPPYYYYDKTCGCCRYYLNNPELERSTRGNSGTERNVSTNETVSQAKDSTGRVSISASSRNTVTIPLRHGGGSSAPSPKYQVARDTGAQKNAVAADTTAPKNRQGTIDSSKSDSVKQDAGATLPQKDTTVPQEKKSRRPSRSR
jgi:hypothetical protein